MLALEPVIVDHLSLALGSAQLSFASKVVGISTSREREVPAGGGVLMVVRIDDSPLNGETRSQIRLGAVWCVDIVARLSVLSAEHIDDCFSLVVQQLHNWLVGQQRGRRWDSMTFQRVQPVVPGQFGDGIYGLSAYFQVSASFKGQSL